MKIIYDLSILEYLIYSKQFALFMQDPSCLLNICCLNWVTLFSQWEGMSRNWVENVVPRKT